MICIYVRFPDMPSCNVCIDASASSFDISRRSTRLMLGVHETRANPREYYRQLLSNAGLAPKVAYASQTIEGVRSTVVQGGSLLYGAINWSTMSAARQVFERTRKCQLKK